MRAQAADNRQASIVRDDLPQAACRKLIRDHHRRGLALYEKLLAMGVCREQARGVLPQNLMTTFWATVDLHNLLHFLDLRDSDLAQAEIREYARGIKQLIRPLVPNVAQLMGWADDRHHD
jgi:thymidylate synthase (FAD)